jgi:hypothetical protein
MYRADTSHRQRQQYVAMAFRATTGDREVARMVLL